MKLRTADDEPGKATSWTREASIPKHTGPPFELLMTARLAATDQPPGHQLLVETLPTVFPCLADRVLIDQANDRARWRFSVTWKLEGRDSRADVRICIHEHRNGDVRPLVTQAVSYADLVLTKPHSKRNALGHAL